MKYVIYNSAIGMFLSKQGESLTDCIWTADKDEAKKYNTTESCEGVITKWGHTPGEQFTVEPG